MRIFISGLLILAFIVASFFGVKELIRLGLRRSQPSDDKSSVDVASESRQKLTEVAIYFAEPAQLDLAKEKSDYGAEVGMGTKLVLEKRQVALDFFNLNLSDKVAVLIRELIKGSQQGMLSPISKNTNLRKVFVDRNGTAYLDFSSEISNVLIQGVSGELMLLELILRTIQENIAQIKKVQILIEGNEIQTISGHIDMSKPLSLSQISNK